MGNYYSSSSSSSSSSSGAALPTDPFLHRYSRIPDNYATLDQLTEALQRAGLESSNLIIGIDFTTSNKWTGRRSFNGQNLHHIGETRNPYEQAISIIGDTLSQFDEDNLIPCFGFGDARTHDKGVFSFYSNGRPCNGPAEVLARYKELAPHVQLSGPTSFAPIIEKAVEIVENSENLYHVLLIIADGQVSASETENLSYQEECTIKAIQKASNFPLSIVLVGVGDGPWDLVNKYDGLFCSRRFDNFQFVNFTEIMSANMPDSTKGAQFALQALMKIPSQYAAIQGLGILGALPGRSIPQVSSREGFNPGVETYDYISGYGTSQICRICCIKVKDMVFGCGHETCSDCGQRLSACADCQSIILVKVKLHNVSGINFGLHR